MTSMTCEQATTFERESTSNAVLLKTLLKCNCSPYIDVFTFNRWKAQSMSVSKGEHGIRLPLIHEVREQDQDGNEVIVRKVLGHSYVFCRCQVHPFGQEHEPAPRPTTQHESAPEQVAQIDNLMKGWSVI